LAVQLQILNGKRQGLVVDLNQAGDMFVGQRDSAQIRIDDPWISWDHARLFQKNNEVWVEDLASTNGTYVNCQRVKSEKLNNEDILFFGKTHALFLQTVDIGPVDYQAGLDMAADNNNVWNSDRRSAGATALGLPSAGFLQAEAEGPAGGGFAANGQLNMGPVTASEDAFPRRGRDPFASGEDFRLLESNDSDDFGLFENSNEKERDPLFADSLGNAPDPFGLNNTAPMMAAFTETQRIPPNLGSRSGHVLPPGSQVGPLPKNTDVNDIESLLSTSSLDDLDDLITKEQQQLAPSSAVGPMPSRPGTAAMSGMAPLPLGAHPFGAPSMGPPQVGAPGPMASSLSSTMSSGMNPGLLGSGINSLPPLPPPSGRFHNPNMPRPHIPSNMPTTTPTPMPVAQSPATATETINMMSKDDLIRRLTLMQGELGQLKGVFQAAQQQNQQEVMAAAQVFKDHELSRLNKQLAEARGELSEAREGLDAVHEELDNVTEEMIEKEDLIQELQDRISQGGDVFAT
jgi:hypothetical protein